MPGECSICLSSLKEPVCIPCGHIYCTKCLADLVNAPNDKSMKAFCPTCRAQFDLSIPDLTFLPKKYHGYVMPSVRRVYLDSPHRSDLKKELKASKERIKKLEKDNEILMRQCERHMAAAFAQAEGERAARKNVSDLRSRLFNMEQKLQAADVNAGEAIRTLECDMHAARERCLSLERTYGDLRRRYEKLKARQDQPNASTSTISITQKHCREEHSLSRKSLPTRTLQLKPKARPASPPPVYVSKRQRLAPAP